MSTGDHWRLGGEFGRSLETWCSVYEIPGNTEVSIGDHWRLGGEYKRSLETRR